MTHQEMVDTIRHGMEKEFAVLSELCSEPAPAFVVGMRKFSFGYRQHIYLLYTEPEFLAAPARLKSNAILAHQFARAIHWPRLDLEKEYMIVGGIHVRMVIPDTSACRERLEILAQNNADWPRYCLLLDSKAAALIRDFEVEEKFSSIKDSDSPNERNDLQGGGQ